MRHGRTAWNADGRFQGHADIELDETGRAQARALGSLLAAERFDVAVSSDLSRARETAEIILDGRGVVLALDSRWREMRFGEWEGLTWPQIAERTPEMSGRSPVAPKGFTPPGGETFEELRARVAAAVAGAAARAGENARLLVATHAGPLHALLDLVLGEREAAAAAIRFSPASVTRIELRPESARLLEVNRTVDAPPS